MTTIAIIAIALASGATVGGTVHKVFEANTRSKAMKYMLNQNNNIVDLKEHEEIIKPN